MAVNMLELRIAGGPICCVPDNLGLMSPFVLSEQGDWFEEEIGFVRRLVKPGMRVIDIGANYGTYTLTMAELVGSTGRVDAFEPAAGPLLHLRRSLSINRFTQVELHPVGLSDVARRADLGSSANPELNSLTGPSEMSEEISLDTLDGVMGDRSESIDFIKMDAEGEEERILAGADRFFARQDPVVMFELKHGADINEGLCEAFMRRGFLIHRLVPGLGVLVPIPLGESLDGYLLNAFAVRSAAEGKLIASGLLVPSRADIPDIASQIRVGACIEKLQASPWLSTSRPVWEPDPAVAGWEDQRRAVALATTVDAAELSPVGRMACLRNAHRAVRRALGGGVTGSRLFTAARICLDLGYRGEAVAHLGQVVEIIMDGKDPTPAFKEPFVLPLRQHERLEGLSMKDLLSVAGLEAYAFKMAFSAYFAPDQIRPVLQRISAFPQHDPRVDRTLKLFESRLGSGPLSFRVG